jgi:hypothetical protein
MTKGSIPGQDNFYTHPKMGLVYNASMELSKAKTCCKVLLLIKLIRHRTTRKDKQINIITLTQPNLL